jgi:CelD/BcsL family acetyltransferase involved in cellulose biosynthesis
MAGEFQISIYDSFAAVEQSWRQFEQTSDNFVFQNFDWLSNWYQAVSNAENIQLCLTLITSSDNQILMLLPLGVEKRGRVNCLIWLGGQVSDYHAPLLTSDIEQAFSSSLFISLWQRICAQLPQFDAIHFEKMPKIINGQVNPFTYLPCVPNASKAHFTLLGNSFEQLLKSRLSNNAIKSAKRSQRRIEEQGKLKFIIASQPEQIDRLLAEMIAQKSRSYQELGVADLFASHGIKEFFNTMSNNPTRLVHLSALLLDDQILATHWGLVYKNRFYYLYPSYERNELSKYSPGTVLLWRLFEWCIQNQITIYDFTIGDEPYKDKWCNSTLDLVDYYQAKTLLGHLLIWPLRTAKKLKRSIKQSEALWQKIQATRALLAKLKRLIS